MGTLIRAENLTKKFEEHTAVLGLDVQVRQGKVLGFLGPNGAGKTTTVQMLTWILRTTGGTASVAGYDVVRDARQVRTPVGQHALASARRSSSRPNFWAHPSSRFNWRGLWGSRGPG